MTELIIRTVCPDGMVKEAKYIVEEPTWDEIADDFARGLVAVGYYVGRKDLAEHYDDGED